MTHTPHHPALATEERPRLRMCEPCRGGKHLCDLVVVDLAAAAEKPCPCRRCHPPAPERCPSCGGFIDPHTSECRCSD